MYARFFLEHKGNGVIDLKWTYFSNTTSEII